MYNVALTITPNILLGKNQASYFGTKHLPYQTFYKGQGNFLYHRLQLHMSCMAQNVANDCQYTHGYCFNTISQIDNNHCDPCKLKVI